MADPVTDPVSTEPAPETASELDSQADVGTTVATESEVESGPAPAPAPDEDTFFDPTDLPPELSAAYKGMQAAYTKKTQAIASDRSKIEQYDRFMSDPQYRAALMQQYADQNPQQPAQPEGDWEPQTWGEVLQKASDQAYERFVKEAQPMLQQVRGHTKTAIETELDKSVPEWRQYEDEMSEALKTHPTLANDPVTLARIALPLHIQEGRAMKAALTKLETKAKGAQVGKGSTTAPVIPGERPNRKLSFAESVAWAKAQQAKAS